jgi:hypothetical protein
VKGLLSLYSSLQEANIASWITDKVLDTFLLSPFVSVVYFKQTCSIFRLDIRKKRDLLLGTPSLKTI